MLCRRLRIFGVFGCPAANKKLVTPRKQTKETCLGAGTPVLDNGAVELCLFRDEVPSIICDNSGKIVWMKKGEEIRVDTVANTVKHRVGGVMVWGCFMAAQNGDIHLSDGLKRTTCIIQSLSTLVNLLHEVSLGDGTLPDTRTTNRNMYGKTLQKLSKQARNTLVCSFWLGIHPPALNPIELRFAEIKRRVRKLLPKNETAIMGTYAASLVFY